MRSLWLAFLAALLLLALPTFSGCEATTLPPGALVTPQHVDPPVGMQARAVVAFAESQLGRPYCWGGTGPRCFDCSGLTQRAWAQVGVKVPRTADAIAATLPEVAAGDVQPGDILWWPGHVGIYAGQGWSIEALNAKSGVIMRRAFTAKRAFRPRT